MTLAVKTAGVFLLLIVIGYFGLRGYVLRKSLEKVQHKLWERYATTLVVKESGFEGSSGIRLRGIELIPQGKDTLLLLDEFHLSIRFWYALLGDIRVSDISFQHGFLQLTKRDGIRNFEGFLTGLKDSQNLEIRNKGETETNYAEVMYKLITRLLNKIPNEVEVREFTMRAVDETTQVDFNIRNLEFQNGQIVSNMEVTSGLLKQYWNLHGNANPSAKTADIKFSRSDTGRVIIPYLPERFNLLTGLGSTHFRINRIDLEDDELRIDGSAGITSFLVNHPKISSRDVVVDELIFNFNFRIGENFASLDSTSSIVLNGFGVRPFIRVERSPDTLVTIIASTEKALAQKFIDALPEGLFSHFKGMEADGSFSYRMEFIYNENHPDQLVFESYLDKEQFRIRKYGSADLARLNGDFVHLPKERGRTVRPILVGPANPYFTSLDQINPLLKKCILTTEDPSFFWHRGFVSEAFKQSLVKNIRTGKFKRGASTISMQLVKNVFLTREKTIARKLEEILLVYVLENNYICSKERMFEVYLNIIEWGPNVYGIGEATRYYFRKSPADLTLSESMFLATIIPSPKHFMWRFGKDGVAKPYLERTYRYLANKMIVRELIVPEDTLGMTHLIGLTGPAKLLVIRNDSLVNDALLQRELLQIENHEQIGEDD